MTTEYQIVFTFIQFGENLLTVHHKSTHDMLFTALYNDIKLCNGKQSET